MPSKSIYEKPYCYCSYPTIMNLVLCIYKLARIPLPIFRPSYLHPITTTSSPAFYRFSILTFNGRFHLHHWVFHGRFWRRSIPPHQWRQRWCRHRVHLRLHHCMRCIIPHCIFDDDYTIMVRFSSCVCAWVKTFLLIMSFMPLRNTPSSALFLLTSLTIIITHIRHFYNLAYYFHAHCIANHLTPSFEMPPHHLLCSQFVLRSSQPYVLNFLKLFVGI